MGPIHPPPLGLDHHTVLDRPWLKLCFTVPALTAPARGFQRQGRPAARTPTAIFIVVRVAHPARFTKVARPRIGPARTSRKSIGERAGRPLPPGTLLGHPRANSQEGADGNSDNRWTSIVQRSVAPSSRKEGEVYHISKAQGQNSIRRKCKSPAVSAPCPTAWPDCNSLPPSLSAAPSARHLSRSTRPLCRPRSPRRPCRSRT